MSEEKILKIVKDLAAVMPAYEDLYFILFVQYRNLYSGANTITRSGLTSPNNGLLREFPASLSPNGDDLVVGNAQGTITTPTQGDLDNIKNRHP